MTKSPSATSRTVESQVYAYTARERQTFRRFDVARTPESFSETPVVIPSDDGVFDIRRI